MHRTTTWAVTVFVATLALYALLAPRIEQRLDPVTGDEPFYMMTAHNILAGRGLNERQSWIEGDYAAFYPPTPLPATWQGWPAFPLVLMPHASSGTIPPGMYSKHGLGLALLIVPAYAIGLRAAIVLFLNVAGALLGANVFLLAFEASGKLWVALAIWLALSFSNPLMPYSFLIFPEIFAGLFVLYAFRRIRAPANNGWQTAGTALAIAALPWLHARFAVLALALFAYWFWKHFWNAAALPAISFVPLMPVALSAAGLFDFYFYLYGSVLPNAQDHGGMTFLVGAAGLFLDQQWGLLIYAPIYLLALAAVFRRGHAWWLAVTAPYLLLIASYDVWWGEWGPPARYLVAILPLLALPLGRMFASARWPLAPLALPLALVSWAEMVLFLVDPQRMYNQPTGKSELFTWLAHLTGVDLTSWVPSFVAPFAGPQLAGAWIAAAALAVAGLAGWSFVLGLRRPNIEVELCTP